MAPEGTPRLPSGSAHIGGACRMGYPRKHTPIPCCCQRDRIRYFKSALSGPGRPRGTPLLPVQTAPSPHGRDSLSFAGATFQQRLFPTLRSKAPSSLTSRKYLPLTCAAAPPTSGLPHRPKIHSLSPSLRVSLNFRGRSDQISLRGKSFLNYSPRDSICQ